MRVFDYKAGAPQFRDRQLSGKEKTDWIGGKSQILCRDLHLRSLESGIFGIEGRRGEKGNAARLRLHVDSCTRLHHRQPDIPDHQRRKQPMIQQQKQQKERRDDRDPEPELFGKSHTRLPVTAA